MFIRFGKDQSVKRTYGEDALDLIGRMLAWVFMYAVAHLIVPKNVKQVY